MVDFKRLKLAAYLDQVLEDPHAAVKVVKDIGLKYIALRKCWSKNIVDAGEQQRGILRNNIIANGLEVILLCTDLGQCPTDQLLGEEAKFLSALNLCEYYKCQYIRIGVGKKSHDQRANIVQEAWLRLVDRKCMDHNIVPCYEISYDLTHSSPVEVSSLLHKYKRLQLIYDPAGLVQTKKIDPFTRYWSLFNTRVSHIDIHDYKIGHAAAFAGHGDCKLDLTLIDAFTKGYQGWLCLEPGLGRRVGEISGLDNVFKLATKNFLDLLSKLDLGNGDANKKTT